MITSRLFALAVIFILMFAGLAGRLFDLQIVHGEEYMSQYESKILRTTYTNGTRGNIYDRDGNATIDYLSVAQVIQLSNMI